MPHRNIITGNSDNEIWNIIADQLSSKTDNLDYTAQFSTGNYCVTVDIDIHPDRGEEDEQPVTTFSAPIPDDKTFTFYIVKQGLKHEIGKLFGMQDVIVGDAVFDKSFLIQTNDVNKVKELFSDQEVCAPLLQQPIVDFKIRERKIGATKEMVLNLTLEGGITDPEILKNGYQSFKKVLKYLD